MLDSICHKAQDKSLDARSRILGRPAARENAGKIQDLLDPATIVLLLIPTLKRIPIVHASTQPAKRRSGTKG